MEKDEEFKRYMMELAENQRLYDIYLQNHGQRVLLANIIHHGKTDEIDSFRAEKSKLVHNRIVLGIRNQDFEYTVKQLRNIMAMGLLMPPIMSFN